MQIPYYLISAILLGLSCLYPHDYAWIILFCYPLPLIYQQWPLRFLHGYIWGLVAYGPISFGCAYSIIEHAYGVVLTRYFLALAVILYLPCYPAIISELFFRISPRSNRIHLSLLYHPCIMLCTHLAVSWFSLRCIGTDGCCLLNPLLPLATNSTLVAFLGALPLCYSYSALFIPSLTLAFFFKTTKRNRRFFSATCAIMMCLSPIMLRLPSLPHYLLASIAVFPFQCVNNTPGTVLPLIISRHVHEYVRDNPTIKTIIMPESAITHNGSWDLAAFAEKITLAGSPYSSPVLIMGTFEGQHPRYNTVIFIKKGIIIGKHYKTNALPFLEEIPRGYHRWCAPLSYTHAAYTRHQPNQAQTLSGWGLCCPLICSELFCNDKPNTPYPILALCNDKIVPYEFMRKALRNCMRLKAARWQTIVIYASYSISEIATKNGSWNQLPCVNG